MGGFCQLVQLQRWRVSDPGCANNGATPSSFQKLSPLFFLYFWFNFFVSCLALNLSCVLYSPIIAISLKNLKREFLVFSGSLNVAMTAMSRKYAKIISVHLSMYTVLLKVYCRADWRSRSSAGWLPGHHLLCGGAAHLGDTGPGDGTRCQAGVGCMKLYVTIPEYSILDYRVFQNDCQK